MSTTFRKKPVEIEAMRTAPADPLVAEKDREEQNRLVAQWIDAGGGEVVGFGVSGIDIATLEGTMLASPGDWIIRGVQGEFYPCKPDIFEQTYEPVDSADSPDDAYVRALLRDLRAGEEPADAMVAAVLDLAASAGMPVAAAAETAVQAVKQFALTDGDLHRVVDMLAAAAVGEHDEAARDRFFTASEHEDVVALRTRIVALAAEIGRRVPDGRNKSLALTALEDVQMRGNRGIFAPEHLR